MPVVEGWLCAVFLGSAVRSKRYPRSVSGGRGSHNGDDWDAVRRNLRVGQRLTGTVERSPWNWGVVGIVVRLDLPFRGFVDLLSLPYDADTWPQPGTVTEFEVVSLDDRPQVRLRAVDGRYRK